MNQTTTLTSNPACFQKGFWLLPLLFLCGNMFAGPAFGHLFSETGRLAPKVSFCEISESDLFLFGQNQFADLDGDGDRDLIVRYTGLDSGLRIYINNGAPDFSFSEKTSEFLSKNTCFDPKADDFDKMLASTAGNTGPYATGMTIQLFASHGLSWSWSGPNGFTSTSQNPSIPSATTVMAGTYNVTVTVSAGVTETASTTVAVSAPVNVCHADVAHVFSIAAVPGATGYTWAIDGATTGIVSGQGTTSITVNLTLLSNGNHLITVIANGTTCNSFPTGLNIFLPPALSLLAANTGPYCVGGTIALTSTPTGGVSPYTYVWSGPAGFTPSAVQNPTLVATTTGANGTYSVTVTDANGCTGVASTNVTVVPDPTVTVTPVDPTICAGGTTTINAAVAGGTGTISYQWQSGSSASGPWTNVGTNSSAYTTAALAATTYYQVIVTQTGIGCSVTGATQVNVVPVPTVSVSGLTPTICTGGGDTLTANVSNGTGTVAYQWQSSPNGTTWTNISPGGTAQTLTVTGVTATTQYRISVTVGGSGCGSITSAAVILTVVPDPTISISGVNAICIGGADTLTAVVNGGTGTSTIQWQSSTNGGTSWGNVGTNSTTYIISGAATGTTLYRATYARNGVDCQTATSNTQSSVVNPDPTASDAVGGIVCQNGPITLTSTGSGGTGPFTYQWEQSASGTGSWANAVGGTGATTTNFSPSTATVGTMYYRLIASQLVSGCGFATSDTAKVIVITPPSVSISGLTPTICSGGGDTLTANVVSGTGSVAYQWQNSPDGTAWTNISPGGTAQTLTVTGITSTTHYRVSVTIGGSGCGSITATPVILNVVPDPTISISGVNAICVGGLDTLTATVNGGTGTSTIQWQSSASAGGPWTNVGTNSTTYIISGASAGTTFYRATYARNGVDCQTATSNTQSSVVNADPTASDAVGGIVCQNGPITLTSTGSGGTGPFTYQWEQSASGTGSWANAVGGTGATTTNFSPSTATVGTMYYRLIASQLVSGCGSATSDTAKVIVVTPPSVSISGLTPTICSGGGDTLTANIVSGTGTIGYQWQSSPNGTTWTNISPGGTASTLTVTGVTATTQYRVSVTIGGSGCGSVIATPVILNVVPDPTISISGVNAICVGGLDTLTATVSGGTGTSTIQWQSSASAGGPWTNVGTNSTTYVVSGASAGTTFFRATYARNGVDCNTATSNSQTSVVNADPTASDAVGGIVCQNGPITLTSTGSGGTGAFTYQWEQSASGTGSWANAVGGTGATTTNFSPSTATVGTMYYRLIASQLVSGCGSATSDTAKVIVITPPSVSISGLTPTICSGGGDTLTANVVSGTGSVAYQWQNSPDGTAWTNISPGGTAQTLTVTGITSTTHYRVSVTIGGSGCGSVIATPVILNVVPDPTISISGVNAICVGGLDTLTATVSGGTGTSTIQWQSSASAGGPWTNVGTNSTTYVVSGASAGTTFFRATYARNGVDCNTATSNSQTSVVNADPTASDAVGGIVCQNGPITLTSTGSGGTGPFTYQWEQSASGSGSWANAVGGTGATTTNFSPSTATVGTMYYRLIASQLVSGCGSATSDTAKVIVVTPPSVSISGLTPTICSGGGDTLTANVVSGTGSVAYQWQSSPDGSAWTNISPGGTASTLTVTGVTATTQYRVSVTIGGSGCGSVIATPVVLNVVPDPTISIAGVNPICIGGLDTLTATVNGGTGSSTIQWQSAALAGGPWTNVGTNSTTYTINGSSTGTTFYRATYARGGVDCNTATSNSQTSVVVADPVISAQPVGDTVCVNGATTILVTASGGTGVFSYQWQTGTSSTGPWTNIGTNSSSYAPVTSAIGSKWYRVIVSQNGTDCNPVTSNVVEIKVKAAPTVTIAGATTICTGGGATLTSTVSSGTGAVTYQWQYDVSGTWTNLGPGSTSATLSVTNLTASRDYRLLVNFTGSGCSQAVSNTQTVTVVPDPVITINWQTAADDTICSGSSANLTATVNNGTGGCTIQWQFYNTETTLWENIAGANAATLNTGTLTATRKYRATYSCGGVGCDPATSNEKIVVVIPNPVVAVAPPPSICPGLSATLTADLTGNGSLTASDFNFQWQLSTDNTTWTDITGATASSYTANYLVTSTWFRVIVTRKIFPCGSTSASAQVIVLPAPAKPGPISY